MKQFGEFTICEKCDGEGWVMGNSWDIYGTAIKTLVPCKNCHGWSELLDDSIPKELQGLL